MRELQLVMEKVIENRSQTVELLEKLVRVDTTVPPGSNYEEIARFTGDYMKRIGCRVTLFKAPQKYLQRSGYDLFDPPLTGPRMNVIGKFGSGIGKTLLFNGHLDTVPIGQGWSKNPFGEIDNGTFYGRGANDDKGGVVAMIMAVKAIIDAGFVPKGEIILTATVDEEIGGISGLGACIEEGVVQADYGVSCDGKQDNIIISNQGRFKGKIITEGLAVHSSMAQQGINAIEIMAKIVLAIQKHDRELRTRATRIPAPPVSGAKYIYPTVNVGTIIGGLKENIVPDYCAITFSRRVTPEEFLNDARKELLQIVADAVIEDTKAKWKYEEMNTREPSYTPIDDPFVLKFKEVAEKTLRRKITVCGGLGGNDACFMRNFLKIPAIQFGPAKKGSNTHKPDENIQIDHLLDAVKVYVALIVELIGVAKTD